ncbi:MAG: Translation initiation factor 3 subunit b [Piccolia ochrophora]|nr:MAG: Translation initiation factor 3 subunit b [Piccolia ochrophora]
MAHSSRHGHHHHLSPAVCSFVPEYVLSALVDADGIPDDARTACRNTVERTAALREERKAVAASLRDRASSGGSNIVPPYVLQSLVDSPDTEPDARESAQRSGAVSDQVRLARGREGGQSAEAPQTRARPRRLVYTSNGTKTLPGNVVRTEGQQASSVDESANECYDGLGSTFDMLINLFNRNSIDGRGMDMIGSVHYDKKYNNAMWDGKQMIFGDGDGIIFNSFTDSLDVIGHELAHGLTERTAGLFYQGQSGALNESVSDVFGSIVKQYHLKQSAQQADWLIGKDLFTPSVNGVALRSMKDPGTAYDDPKLSGKDPQPGTMAGYVKTREDNGGVHINSGIPNHAFCLLALDLGGNSWDRAGPIWYNTLIDPSLLPDADFDAFADITVKTALKLFGQPVQAAVQKAWAQVGIAPSQQITQPLSAPPAASSAPIFNLESPSDLSFAFDYDHSGKLDHLVFYRPGTGTFVIQSNNKGVLTTVYPKEDVAKGIGGYDLLSPADRAYAFDFDHSGKLDHILLYRPGTGKISIVANKNGTFESVLSR